MHGFEDLSRVRPELGHEAASPYVSADLPASEHYVIADLTGDEIDRLVRRGRRLRATHLASWGQQALSTWKSLFRPPGRIVPTPGVAAYRK